MYQNLLEDETDTKQDTAGNAEGAPTGTAPLNDETEAQAETEAHDDTKSGNAGDSDWDGDNEGTTGNIQTPVEATDDAGSGDEATNTGNTDVPQTPAAIATALKVELGAASELAVENAEEVEDAKPAVDKRRALLRLQGLSDDMIDKILPIVSTTRKTQRQLPVDSTVCSPEMIAFFEGRDDATITGDCVKGIRNDGGPYGPAGMYERTLIKLGVDAVTAKTAGEVLADKVNHRIVAIRVNVVATINELRRRRAVADGLNPRAEKYLRVR